MSRNENAKFELDGRPNLSEAVPLAFQHIINMFVGNMAPVLIISRVANLAPEQTTMLLQCALFTSAIATIIQNYPIKIGSFQVGARLPAVMGVSFGFLPAMLAIVAGKAENIPMVFGAQIVGGICSVFMGIGLKKIRKFFPPIVAGTVVFSIGLSLFPVGIKYMAGGAGSPTFGSLTNWGVSMFVLCVVLFFNQYTKGALRMAAVLLGIIAGYILAAILGLVNFAPIASAAWFSVPQPFFLGPPKFEQSAIITMVIMYLVTAVQAIGDFSALTNGGLNREVTDKELSGGVVGNGVSAVISGIFNAFPTATYSQNVGLVVLTKVVSRYVLLVGSGILLLAAFIPKFGAIIGSVPSAVIGGGTILVFSLITMTGISIIIKEGLEARTMAIVGLAIAMGSGIGEIPEALQGFSPSIRMIFGSSVVISTIIAFVLNLLFPHKKNY